MEDARKNLRERITKMEKSIVHKWESLGKKYWLVLYKYDDGSYGYKGEGCAASCDCSRRRRPPR